MNNMSPCKNHAVNCHKQFEKTIQCLNLDKLRKSFFTLQSATLHMEPTLSSYLPFSELCSFVPTPNITSISFNLPLIGAAAEHHISCTCEAVSASQTKQLGSPLGM